MALQKFLSLINGVITSITAVDTSAGVADAGKLVALDITGKLADTLMPLGVGTDVLVAPASEALAAGDAVNIWADTGTVKIRKANATDATKPAHGFVKAAVESASNASVYFEGVNAQLTGLTVGSRYYLSAATPGAITATPPAVAGNVVQYIGTPHAVGAIRFEPGPAITLA